MKTTLDQILSSDRLPTLPEVAVRVIELAKSATPDLGAITKAIKADPAISSQILKTANSAMMGLRQRASSVDAAVPLLGANMVRSLVLGFTLADQCRESPEIETVMRQVWRRSLIQASAMEFFAELDKTRDQANWFLAGLLQDIGQLAMLHCCGSDYSEIIGSGFNERAVQVEADAFGFSHVDVSVALCRNWRVDDEIVDAIESHHMSVDDALGGTTDGALACGLVAASCCADYLLSVVESRECDRSDLDRVLTNAFGFLPDEITDLLNDIDCHVNQTSATLDINAGDFPPARSILHEAQSLLAEIALQAQLKAFGAEQQLAAALEESSRIQDEAWSDSLTGVFNRSYLDPAVDQAAGDCLKQKSALGCLFLDVDGFKEVNDNHGHEMGDQALRQVGEILKTSVRNSDYVIRYGGDEFCVLLVGVNERLLWRIAERIRERIADIDFPGTDAKVSGSIGALILKLNARKPVASKKLIASADAAMYESKKKGGNRVSGYLIEGRKKTRLQTPVAV